MSVFRIEGFVGEGRNTAAAIAQFLSENPDTAEIVVNSPGGDAFEGSAILAEIERHGRVSIRIEGVAASAASLIAVGGATIVMHAAAVMMIHEPASISWGSSAVHRKSAEVMEKLTDIYARAYSRATGNPLELVKQWMADETWLDASEAVALNFADQVEGEAGQDAPTAAMFNYTKFKDPPALFVELVNKHGWATASSAEIEKEKYNA